MIKVLFISRGNSVTGISPITKNQGDSLTKYANLDYFSINGKGLKGYIKAIPKLRKVMRSNEYDVIHAHYSLSAFTASLSGAKPLVVSLMGSDVSSNAFYKFFIKFFNYFFWKRVIVKSDEMKSILGIKDVFVIPNGVDFDKFKPIDKSTALIKTGWDISRQHILFAANPNRPEKNYKIAKEAFDLLDNKDLELHFLENVSNNDMPYYFNAADVVLLTSLREGSPNVIKEAMACNIPIVSTNVGDVKKVLKDTKGCYIVKDHAIDISDKISKVLGFNKKTTGRNDMQYLNSDSVAKKIMNIYNSVLNKSSEYAQ
jgi:glycosyltransferase involved in cell wall biosynthesis